MRDMLTVCRFDAIDEGLFEDIMNPGDMRRDATDGGG